MTVSTEEEHPQVGSLYVAISNMMVGMLREYTGRGPTKAKTTIRENIVVIMLEQTLTKGEAVLVKKGRGDQVLTLRHEFQEAMREESSEKIAELTGRKVVAMMSANHLDPDLGAEIYVLDRPPDYQGMTSVAAEEIALSAPAP
jgi:uncharacterized protein YbcI